MRLLLATDAWHPQVNGVVRSLEHMVAAGRRRGHDPVMLTPLDFASVPLPGYAEIRLSLVTARGVARRFPALAPTHVHIATEGPIGLATRRVCLAQGRPFTTSYHTRFPNTSPPACRCRNAGATRACAGSTVPPAARW